MCELEQMKKSVIMLNSGTVILEWILEIGKRTEDHGGLWFKGNNLGNNVRTKETQKSKNHHHRRKTSTPALGCYYYGKLGHTRKECSHFQVCQKMYKTQEKCNFSKKMAKR